MKLHQLSNGNWIDLNTVTEIRILPWCRGEKVYPDRVVIHTNSGTVEVLPCDDAEQATAMVNELAGLVNQVTL